MGVLARRVSVLSVLVLAVASLVSADMGEYSATVTAGALHARISPAPWRLSVTDGQGNAVLTEHPGTGTGPTGTLGFRTAAGWSHATRVLSDRREGDDYVAELATTDPHRRLTVRISPSAEGVIALDALVQAPETSARLAEVTAVGIGFEARPGERYLGFGERSNAVDQRGNTVENYVSDGPYRAEQHQLVQPYVPAAGLRKRADATYFPIPWVLSTAGYGVLVDNDHTSYYRLGTDTPAAWSLEVVDSSRLSLRIFAGPEPADVLRRFTRETGRQPPAAAPWFFGPWFQPTGSLETQLAQLRRLRTAGAAVSVAQTYTHYLPCGDHRGRRSAERAAVAAFHDAGVAVTTYLNPMLCTTDPAFREAVERAALVRTPDGEPYLYDYTAAAQYRVGQFDLATSAGRDLFTRFLADAVEDGYDGWMEDFGEYTPIDARSAGAAGAVLHNRYPVGYHCAAHDFARRQPRPIARFQRSGWTGAAPCASVVWGGDPTTTWGFDGLRSAVTQALSMGLSGISTWGSDIGGYFSLGSASLTPELLIRWIQLGAVSGIMRTQAEGIAIPPRARPQIWDDEILPAWRRYARLRTQLYPYLAAADAQYQRTGMPVMRHLALRYPDDPAAIARETEFLFGPDLLAAPVLEPGAETRELYLPTGQWIDLWRSVRMGPDGLRLGAATMLSGGRRVTVPAPLAELPLLVRAGTILPLLPADVETLADYGGSDVVGAEQRADELELLAFPRGRSSAGLYSSGTVSAAERPGEWELAIDGQRERTYRLQASLQTLDQELAPCRVTLDGAPLPAAAWDYDRETHVLTVRFRTRHGQLVASCPR